jgi:hypothetical protein
METVMTTTERKVIKAKVGLLELAKQLGSLTQACRVMGYSRDSFYRLAKSLASRSIHTAISSSSFAASMPPTTFGVSASSMEKHPTRLSPSASKRNQHSANQKERYKNERAHAT